MSSSETTPSSSIPFRSKKTLQSSSKSPFAEENALSSKTPEKPTQVPRRTRNRNALLSITEVRRAAEIHRKSNVQQASDQTSSIKSSKRAIASWSSESTGSRSRNEVDVPRRLPRKHEMLSEFFDSLDSAIRLLRLKGSASNFTNISRKVECLTDRRFSYGHLAQLKFILPEAIEIKKVLVFDERTSCMKPDLHVAISDDMLENDGKLKKESGNMHLRKVFRMRLEEYISSHPENDEVPQDMLPEPFNPSSQDLHPIPTYASPVKISADSLTFPRPKTSSDNETGKLPFNHSREDQNLSMIRALERTLPLGILTKAPIQQPPAVASHVSQHFRRHFSQKATSDGAQNTHRLSKLYAQCSTLPDPDPSLRSVSSDVEIRPIVPSGGELPSEPTVIGKCLESSSSDCLQSSWLPATPCKVTDTMTNECHSSTEITVQSTPAKLALTPARLMTITPTIPPPKKRYTNPDDGTCSPNTLVRRPAPSRSLKFDTLKNEKSQDDLDDTMDVPVDDDIFYLLPESLLQSIREKERKAKEERNPAISQAKRRQQLISRLPKLFNIIQFLFHSINRTVITKKELIHKIIAGHCEIVDKGEVEEQLTLLQELVPEWISEKLVSGGDLLLCINKISSPELIRARLEEAN